MSAGDAIGVALPYGFGDSIVSVHLMVKEFREDRPNHVFNLSPRWGFTEELLELIERHLPKFTNHDLRGTIEFNMRSLGKLRGRFGFPILDMLSSRPVRAFDYRCLVGSRPTIPGRYVVVSGDTVARNRTLEPELWARTSELISEAGLIPVLVGRSSPEDRHRCEYQADGIDLRNTTSLTETIDLLGHAEACFCIANAVSVLAHEVGCRTLCVGRDGSRKAYAETYFTGPSEVRINYDRPQYLGEAGKAVQDWLKSKRTGLSTGATLQPR